jgi:hypothetical protein
VDSNGWRIRLARERAPNRKVWLTYAPPAKAEVSSEAYVMAVADAAAYGGRWVISLDESLTSGLAVEKPQARETWKQLTARSGFFRKARPLEFLSARGQPGRSLDKTFSILLISCFLKYNILNF